MRKLAIAMALASTALATPAVARDQSWYVGIEGGAILVEDTGFDLDGSYDGEDFDYDDVIELDHKYGVDVDLIAGYDFGGFRAEAEVGYKRASIDEVSLSNEFSDDGTIDIDGSVRVWSAMVNLLADFSDDESGWSGFVGPGIGAANVRYNLGSDDFEGNDFDIEDDSSSDSALAWQITAGVRKAISYNLDLGLKYRFFNVRKLDFGDDEASLRGRFRSHSLLASLVYNFGAPPVIVPPPVILPPPPLPPATQTCPDGSVILATDSCPPPPEPYVPPPPPPVEPERG